MVVLGAVGTVGAVGAVSDGVKKGEDGEAVGRTGVEVGTQSVQGFFLVSK